jgi:uncharacterized protein (UPF0332 family)
MRWDTYLTLAEEVLACDWGPKLVEASARAAVSRAYYAIFNCARLRLVREGISLPEDGTAHGEVMRAFAQHNDLRRRKIANILRELRDVRRQADYDDHATLHRDAAVIIDRARQCLRLLNQLPDGP